MAKIRFSKKNAEFNVPEINGLIKQTKDETLMLFGNWWKNPRYSVCVGLGRVTKVVKGEGVDLVSMCFGRRYPRRILVTDNHARRQIYTLKRGQLAWFYGLMGILPNEEGKVKVVFYAYGFQAWFVPKALDIKTYNTDDLERIEKEQEIDMLHFLDDVLKGE